MTFSQLLHPGVAEAALKQYSDGHHRDAVLNAIIAVFDALRARTGLDLDGVELANRAFSEQRPYLIVGDLQTESGRNAQLGAMMLARGLYQGVRSPSAHTVSSKMAPLQAARFLVAASAVAQIIDDAQQGDNLRFDGVYASPDTKFGGANFLRFFPGGTVLSVSIGGDLADDWVPDWLTLDWAEWQGKTKAAYEIEGNRLSFTVSFDDGEVRYKGQVSGLSLRLRWQSTVTKKCGDGKYAFRPYTRGAA